MDLLLNCKVGLGQFSQEFAVEFEAFDGQLISLFVPQEVVQVIHQPTEGELVDGQICVELQSKTDGLRLVRLPRPTLENGQFVTVRSDQLMRSKISQQA